LTRLPELLVTARTSSFHFKGQDIPVPEIAAALGVAHIVEGSVRRDGSRLRITAQLIRAVDGFHLWSENYDRETEDTFGVQSDIAEKIALALNVVMNDERREHMHAAGVRNPEAFIAFQKGVELFEQAHGSATMLDTLHEANSWFERALESEPGFSYAYSYHSDYFTHFLMDAIDNENVTDDERAAALKSLTRDLNNAVRLATNETDRVGNAYDLAVVTGQWRKLPALFDDMLAAPGCGPSSWVPETSTAYGKAEGTLDIGLREADCNPMNFSGYVIAINASVYLGDPDSAIEIAEKGLATASHIRIYQSLFFAFLAAGRFDAAESLIDRHVHRDTQVLPLRVMLSAARLDASPNGHLALMLLPTVCRCGAPFDLEATPNFARLIEDADFPWPPVSPIEWPLKDW